MADDTKNLKDQENKTVEDTAASDVEEQPTTQPEEAVASEEPVVEAQQPTKEIVEAANAELEATSNVVEDEKTQETVDVSDKSTDETVFSDTTPKHVPTASDAAKWYIVHTYSGHENKVAKSLHQRVESMGFETRIFDIIVPTRNTIKVSQGKKETVKEKIFPGYVLVKMILDDESWLLVRTTQGVTAFIGAGNKPTPISEKEVEAIQKFMQAEEPLFTTSFTTGEAVKIVDGPFADFLGTVDNIDEAKGKLKVLVSIFGRETPVELDFLQVSKL